MTAWNQTKLSRRHALYLMSGVMGGLALHGCGQPSDSSSSADAPETDLSARVGIVTWTGYAPIYIARAKEFYQELGLNADFKVFNSGTEAIAAFNAGQLDGLSLVPSEAVALAAGGKDYRIVYVVDTSNGGDGILARNSVKDIADFKGKQIAVERGSVSHFFLLQAMAEVGLSETDVTLVSLSPDAAAAAYQAGNADIAVTYAPFLFTANAAQTDGRIIYDSSKLAIPTAIADLIIFDTQFIETQPQAVEAFIRANLKGLEFLTTNASEGQAIAAQELQITPEDFAEQLKGIKLATLEDNISMLNDPSSNLYLKKPLESMSTFLKAQGLLETEPNLDSLLDPQFVLAIQQG